MSVFADPIAPLAFMLLREFLPDLATLVAGRSGGRVARGVIRAAKRITGKQEFNDIFKSLSEDQTLAFEFKKEILEFEKKIYALESEDFRGARERDMILIQSGHGNRRADIMIIGAIGGLFFCLAILVQYRASLPGEIIGAISAVAGILAKCLNDAYAFEFGASRGSKEPDRQMAALLGRPLKDWP